ncbi:HK97 family phage prohead protease [Lysinibacillus capsici]|uniref:HK97 family phage prohead protease n=1 Tax=Lysinibacillus capsici TaxID=2115968 RepID=UPI00272FA38A|nr:HK97 family phage prohead protease [Lysinibacillus capsici]MDP1394775.1 HK97 family phage prohead protease [Lysinibacillus capsici]MDP1415164.1 HK97 family phage prohead protease [Lysinibacillus capsici]MDP1431138.1 HK97 family phage prohead protease [Lysinibacillus capsici]
MRIEIRGNQVLLDGYVNAVERESRVLPSPRGRFKEKTRAKTFERALDKAENVDLLFNHDKNRKLGSLQEGNLQLYEDSIGLRAIAYVSDEEIIQKAKDGKLKGWSFGFVDNKPSWEDGEDGIQKRTLEDIELLEVSILDITPAYIATSIEARGEEQAISETRGADFKAEIENRSEETRSNKDIDYSLYEKQIELLKLKGGK